MDPTPLSALRVGETLHLFHILRRQAASPGWGKHRTVISDQQPAVSTTNSVLQLGYIYKIQDIHHLHYSIYTCIILSKSSSLIDQYTCSQVCSQPTNPAIFYGQTTPCGILGMPGISVQCAVVLPRTAGVQSGLALLVLAPTASLPCLLAVFCHSFRYYNIFGPHWQHL